MEDPYPIEYTIDALPAIFLQHARIAEQMHEEHVKSYLETSDNAPLPEHLKNPFNIAQALSVMCQAIKNLQAKQFP